jgi:hypothetical protein
MSQPTPHSDTDQTATEHTFLVLLRGAQKTNGPWLEKQSELIEQALIDQCSGWILGPSVSVNFDENGFELDLTVVAESASKAHASLGEALEIVERVADISLGMDDGELRSSYHSPGQEKDHEAVLVC